MTVRAERRMLQAAIAIAGLVPICGGTLGVLFGAAAFDPSFSLAAQDSVALDSHVRYLSGLLLAIGLTFYSLIPTIERQTLIARVLTAIVFVGGLARLYGAVTVSPPKGVMAFALVMELAVTPLLCLWQGRVARLSGAAIKPGGAKEGL